MNVGLQKEWQRKFYLRRFENDCVRHSHTVIWEFGDFEGLQFGVGASQLIGWRLLIRTRFLISVHYLGRGGKAVRLLSLVLSGRFRRNCYLIGLQRSQDGETQSSRMNFCPGREWQWFKSFLRTANRGYCSVYRQLCIYLEWLLWS